MVRKYKINEKFFDTWSDEMAYVLGVIAADGCVAFNHGYVVSLGVAVKDIAWLMDIKKIIDTDQPLYTHPRQLYVNLRMNSKYLVNQLISMGITPRKSKTLKFPDVPEKYISHFIRGYFDGDGCIHFNPYGDNGVSLSCTICGSENIIDNIQNIFNKVYGKTVGHKRSRPGCYQWRLHGNKSSKVFFEWIYQNSEEKTRLERKYNRYINHIRSKDADRK